MAEKQQTELEPTQEDRFREIFRDMVVVVEKLAPHCENISDLTVMLKLATENSGQLHLLMSQIVPVEFRQK